MALNEIQQIFETIKKANNILIAFKKDYSLDAVASSIALSLFLEKMGKLNDIICAGFNQSVNLNFIPAIEKIKPEISNLQKMIISLNLKEKDIGELSYDVGEDKLNIFIIPKKESFNQEDISLENSDFKYDLIFVLDSPDLESLDEVYQNHTEFFYNTPVINIDHNPENEHFGQINLIDLTATATSEILFNLIENLNLEFLDKEIATCLLTGLISKTKSFKTLNVTPKTLNIASRLIAAEAERETIVRNLYKSKTLGTLNLWGKVLARLRSDLGGKLIWSILNSNDFIEAGVEPKNLEEIIDELLTSMPAVEMIALIYQYNNHLETIFTTLKGQNALYLTRQFNPKGTKNFVRFCLENKSLVEGEKEIIETIKGNLER